MLTSPWHCEVSCSRPAHPTCTWTSFWATLPAGKASCLTTRIKCSSSNTCALGWHGRSCQLAGQPLLMTGGTLNHPGHPYSVHLTPCPPHLELPLIDLKPSGPALTCPVFDWVFLSVILDRAHNSFHIPCCLWWLLFCLASVTGHVVPRSRLMSKAWHGITVASFSEQICNVFLRVYMTVARGTSILIFTWVLE